MPDFYFRGSLAQYWQAIYAEYLRLTPILQQEPFSIILTGLFTSLSEYSPTIFDNVIIQFVDKRFLNPGNDWVEVEKTDLQAAFAFLNYRLYCIVLVKAETAFGVELVNLDVTVYVDELKKSDGSAYARWLEIQNSWLEKGLLINPAASIAEIGMRSGQLSKPQSGADLTPFFDRYHQKKKDGQKYTLIQIAKETGFEYPYVRQLHSKYLKKRELKPEKRTHKRTHKN